MGHWLFVPVLLPLLGGILAVLAGRAGPNPQRGLSLAVSVILLAVAAGLFAAAGSDDYHSYALGDWPAPYGIVLVLDRLSALLLLLTAMVALASLIHAVVSGTDTRGSYFHPLFNLQLFGLNGAFLTGDVFNLFVFFEVLLIASYGLLLHGGGRRLTRAGLHYVVLNLIGSALFLFAVGALYGATGTLNMADLSVKVAAAPPEDALLVRAGGLLLLMVFALKAALLPLYFWLPQAYAQTTAPIAALFAIMTKVGVYAIVRIYTLVFGPEAGIGAGLAEPWILPLALATLTFGSLGVFASRDLRLLLAYFVVLSIGTLLVAVGLFDRAGLSAALVYLVHTTLISAGMFLLADLIERQRGGLDKAPAPAVAQPLLLGVLFFGGAVALAGVPPFSGFLAKLMILQATWSTTDIAWSWTLILVTSLLGMVALSRMGSALFWKTLPALEARPQPSGPLLGLPALALLASGPLLVALAGPVTAYADATARQLLAPQRYVDHVLGEAPPVPATAEEH
ncbi:MAG: monovalent cation/H+ antiporter subunit D [Candidatus Competibacterales bacterium]|nr:monovalent cation/H+ antiporter subunit D [Candidatus Competibacterales bacterium]